MICFNDNYFDTHQTNDFFLSGQVDLAGFSFAVTDEKGVSKVLKHKTYQRAIISYDDWAKELTALVEQESLLKKTYRSSTWTFLSNKATLLPKEFLKKDQLRACLDYTVGLDDLDEIHHYALPSHKAFAVYTVPSPPANVISKCQPKSRFLHQQVQLLSQFRYLSGTNKVLLHISSGLADIVLYVDDKLVLCNTYQITTFSDVLYNLMLVLKLYNLHSNNTMLHYMGAITDADHSLLCRYFRSIRNIYNSTVRGLIGEKNATSYHSLLTLSQCE